MIANWVLVAWVYTSPTGVDTQPGWLFRRETFKTQAECVAGASKYYVKSVAVQTGYACIPEPLKEEKKAAPKTE